MNPTNLQRLLQKKKAFYNLYGHLKTEFITKGVKLLTRLRVGLSHLRKHKFRHSFQDTLNPKCDCGKYIKITSHYLLHCPDYLQEWETLLNTISCIVPNIFYLNNDQLTEILLYGKKILIILIIEAYWMSPLTT